MQKQMNIFIETKPVMHFLYKVKFCCVRSEGMIVLMINNWVFIAEMNYQDTKMFTVSYPIKSLIEFKITMFHCIVSSECFSLYISIFGFIIPDTIFVVCGKIVFSWICKFMDPMLQSVHIYEDKYSLILKHWHVI